MTDQRRLPRTFEVRPPEGGAASRGPDVIERPARDTTAPRAPRAIAADAVRLEDDAFLDGLDPALDEPALLPKRRFSWAGLAVASLTALLGLAFGLWVERIVGELLERSPALGVAAMILAGLVVLAALALVVREIMALRNLAAHAELRRRAREAVDTADPRAASQLVADLATMLAHDPATARGRRRLVEATHDVIDAADRLAIAERTLLEPLDARARVAVLRAAKRVSVVTAVAPKALIDVAFVLLQSARIVREVAEIYGVRPGRLGFLRLVRATLAHLAVTGTIAVGDTFLGEALGHSVASRLSSRLGEGLVNGLLTARVGIAAMDLCRPLPFVASARPTIATMARELAAGPATGTRAR